MLKKLIRNKTLREWVEAILLALVVAIFIRTWLYSTFRVPTGSMIPTIAIGDQIVADMNVYGLQVPFTDYKIWKSDINRGDIVIFSSPENPEICNSSLYSLWDATSSLVLDFFVSNYVPTCVDYIKRVIAVGGDEIEILGEKALVNSLPEKGYTPYIDQSLPSINIYQKQIVPDGYVFVMGDNRRNSYDARFWQIDGQPLSFLAENKIKAKGKFIYFSKDPNKSALDDGIKWDRIFMALK